MISDRALFLRAKAAYKNAYVPYSNFPVGAAVATRSGEIFTGVNVENAAYGATICAERSALSKAITEGSHDIERIAIAVPEGTAFPCGTCRQVIFEFGGDIRVIVGDDEDSLGSYTINELLPHGFRLEK